MGERCVCSKVEKLTGKEKVKIHVPKNCDLATAHAAIKLKDFLEQSGNPVEIVTR
jgi:hypothetical protein